MLSFLGKENEAKTLIKRHLTVRTQIQGEDVRVMSGSKDDLQAVMTLLRSREDLDFHINFTNYR